MLKVKGALQAVYVRRYSHSTKKQRGALFFSGVTIVRGGGGGRGKKKRGIEPTEEEEAKGRGCAQ